MTWQKIAPLIILSFCLNYFLFIFSILFSVFIAAINGINQTSLRKLIAYSSINHLGWIVASIINNENIWKIYFIFYSFLTFAIIFILKNFNLFNLNQIFSFFYKNNNLKFFICCPLLSLGGLPPFLGFFPKWIVIEILIFFKFYFLIFFIIIFSLITLYFYIRICYTSFLINFNKINFNLLNLKILENKKIIFLLNFISIFGLIFINLMFLF
jgi:NADH-ubiquinone oxidoreductase chain 2